MNHPFEIGGRYENRTGKYEVLEIDGEKMTIQLDDGTKHLVTVAIQAKIWQRIQDEASPQPVSRIHSSDDEGLDTQPVAELVRTVLNAKFSFPYPEDITDQVCLAIEHNPEWMSRYHNLVEHFSSQGKNGKLTVNSSIGLFTKEYTGMINMGEGKTAKSDLIGYYSRLGYPKESNSRTSS